MFVEIDSTWLEIHSNSISKTKVLVLQPAIGMSVGDEHYVDLCHN